MDNLDQFYTRRLVSYQYCRQVSLRWPWGDDILFIEPSAGSGSFVSGLLKENRKFRAIDISPPQSDYSSLIQQGDFLQATEKDLFNTYGYFGMVAIGNPPFGKNSNMAVKFFNHAAKYVNEIAFIVPRTFRKISIQNRLNLNFHLTRDEDVEKNAFIYQGEKYDVPCAWQIWSKKSSKRNKIVIPDVSDLIEYTDPLNADFAMRRVGFYSGRIIKKNLNSLSRSSHYFIKEKKSGVMEALENVIWKEITDNTVGPRSLSKSEINLKLLDIKIII